MAELFGKVTFTGAEQLILEAAEANCTGSLLRIPIGKPVFSGKAGSST